MDKPLAEAYIIVVEDDPNDQLITVDLLRLGGANRCYCRRSVNSAMSFAERLPKVDLFLVDVNMPERSGYELLEEVRQNEKLQDTPVVAVSAGTSSREINIAKDLGFDGFLCKPLKASSFPERVREVLSGKKVWEHR